MRKRILNLFLIIFVFLLGINVYASTTTYDRNELEHYGVSSSINITGTKKNIILNTPKVDASEKIYDFADLYSEQEEKELYTLITSTIGSINHDLVIVTINSNNKSNAEAYADDFYDYNDFGTDSSFSGILLLIDMDNREYHITTTGTIRDFIDDNTLDHLLDDLYDDIHDGNYYDAAKLFIDKSEYYAVNGPIKEPFPWVMIVIISITVPTSVTIYYIFKNKMVKQEYEASSYSTKDGTKIINASDHLVNTFTTSVVINNNSRSGGGHVGSSGRSHGGGSRGF